MPAFLVCLLTAFLGLSATALAAGDVRLVVGFEPGATASQRSGDLRRAGVADAPPARALDQEATIPELEAVVIEVPRSDAADILRKLRRDSGVAFAERDHIARVSFTPDDPRLASQWALPAIKAFNAWDIATGEGAIVAVVDTGVDYNHPDLQGRVILGSDFVDEDGDPDDENGHGTHVAGIAAAVTNNGKGMAGVAPDATIMALRALDADGSGYYSWIANAVIEAADEGADVINLSLGGGSSAAVLQKAIHYAQLRGAVVTCASGNDGANRMGYPARYSACVAVGSSTSSGALSGFSNRGTGLDIVAPGSSILSAVPGTGYESWSGTSMATPVVSGVAALLSSQGLSGQQVEQVLRSSATDRGKAGYDTSWGHGLVNALKAVQLGTTKTVVEPPNELVAPTITSVAFGAREVDRIPKVTYHWKKLKQTKWKRVAKKRRGMKSRWKKVTRKGARRRIAEFRVVRRSVYKRILVHERRRRTTYTTKVYRRFTVSASDANGIRGAGFSLSDWNGERWIGNDWSPGNGLSIRWRCVEGWYTLTAHVADKAGNIREKSVEGWVSC